MRTTYTHRPENTGDLTPQQISDIAVLMGRGLSMRKAKRQLGITKKNPIKDIIRKHVRK